MPPKAKITKEKIIQASLSIVRNGGISALNARAIANELKCSTQPIFRFYTTMEEVKTDVTAMIGEYYSKYFDEHMKTQDVPPYKASGLAYIQFAKDEREFFKVLFMRDRTSEQMQESEHSFETAVKIIMDTTGLDNTAAKKLHLQMWIFVHGIATLIVTSYLDISDELISELLTDTYLGAIQPYIKKGWQE